MMNIINRVFLKAALLPAGFYSRIGVNTAQLKSILTTKLTMDDRRPPSLSHMRRRKKDKPVSKATIGTMLVSALFGVFYLLLFSLGKDVVTQLTFYFTVFFVMLSLTLIADFTSVLIDIRDNFIILPKPVNDRTFVVARLLHIFIHICKIVLPMGLPATVMMVVRYGIGGAVAFFCLIFLLTAFAIFFINALYLLILKLTTPQRFQSIISYVQIIFAIVMYGGYQVFPRMISWVNFEDFDISTKKGIGFYPLYWLAQSWNVLYHLSGTWSQVGFALAGVLFPLFGVYLVVKYLAPSFNQKLALITSTSGGETTAQETKVVRRNRYLHFWSGLLTSSKAEKGSFQFTWKMTARSRDFKLKVYPSVGYLVVYVFVVVFGNKRFNFGDLQQSSSQSKILIISALYFTSLLLTMAISQMVYSEKYKAGWLFFTSPLQRPGEIISGATKAVIVKFYVPVVLIITAAGLFVVGPEVLPNIILGLFNQVLIATLLVYIGQKYFPFSAHQSNQVKTGAFLRGFSILIISGLIGIGHYLLYSILPAVLLCTALSVVASWLLFDALKRTSWNQVVSRYAEE
jgi:ABC-2 type transport system permease protein